MKTILISRKSCVIEGFLHEARYVEELEILRTFQDEQEAYDMVGRQEVDLAIIDLDMEKSDGADIGWKLKKKNPDILLIYLTKEQRSLMNLIRLHPVAVMEVPFREGEIRYVVESAYLLSKRKRKRIYARTFGHFDVFVDDEPIMFKSHKAKELLALLVDRRGGTVTTDQIIGTLWEERPNDQYTQNLCSKIGKTLEKELKENNIEHILVSARGIKRVNTSEFRCDFYDLVDGDEKAAEKFFGEYMLEYSWAEERMALLSKYI